MTIIQKIVYDSLRAFGYAYVSTDARDGSIKMLHRATLHCVCLYQSAHLYEISAKGAYVSVTFR
jgi:hypothetical protein